MPVAALLQLPPRWTRTKPDTGPCGSVTGAAGYSPNQSCTHSPTLPCIRRVFLRNSPRVSSITNSGSIRQNRFSTPFCTPRAIASLLSAGCYGPRSPHAARRLAAQGNGLAAANGQPPTSLPQVASPQGMPAEAPEGYCALHAVMMELRNNANGSWYSHLETDEAGDYFCKGKGRPRSNGR